MKDGPAGVSIVRIRYRECENTGQALENESWGISQITIDTNLKKVNVSWLDDRPHKEFDTIGKATLVIEPERKNRMPVLTPKRARRQEAFRRNLIDLYGRCVLTGEATSEALEAAHIVSVKDEGNDYVGNGLLLRADLHRLFDSKLLKVRSNGTVYFSDTAAVSEEYKKAATKWALAPEVLHRVQRRLGERNDASQETPSK